MKKDISYLLLFLVRQRKYILEKERNDERKREKERKMGIYNSLTSSGLWTIPL